MKKIIVKDKKLRSTLYKQNRKMFVLKSIFQNSNLFFLVRWNAYIQLKAFGELNSEISLSPRCIYTINRKRFNKLTPFSRYVFLKLIQSGNISGFKKFS